MSEVRQGLVLRYLRRLVARSPGEGVSDSELLERFVKTGDQAAFELLVWRHERMVFGVCRRVLRNHHDAEDAFQATFLILARKAASIRNRQVVAGWLYRIAFRVAHHARPKSSRRERPGNYDAELTSIPSPREAGSELLARDIGTVLEEEMGRLPEKYRVPVVLCYLEGKTYEEAARQLGLPKGTLSARLTRARGMLQARLTQRGVGVGAGMLAVVLCEHAASAAVPATLVAATVKAALLVASGRAAAVAALPQVASLAEGVLRSMFLAKLKAVSAVAFVVASLGSGAGLIYHTHPGDGAAAPAVQDIATQIKRQYDSLQSLHVKWRTMIDAPDGIGPEGQADIVLLPTGVDEFAVSGKRQYRHSREVMQVKDLNLDLGKSPQVPYQDDRLLYDGERFYAQRFRCTPPKKPEHQAASVTPEGDSFWRNGRALYMECIGSPYYDGGYLGPWARQAFLGKIKGYVPQRHFSILTIFQGGGYRVRQARETVGGADCWVVEDAGQDKLWLDPAKGYALVQREWNWGLNRPLQFRYLNSDFKEVAAGLWLPLTARCEAMYDPDKGPKFAGKVQARYSITALWCQANNAPEDLFRFHYAPGVFVVDDTRLGDGKQIGYIAGQTPEDNEAALAQAIQEVKEKERLNNQMVKEEDRSSNRGWHIIWASVVLGLVVVAYQLVRRWRGRPAAGGGSARPTPGGSG